MTRRWFKYVHDKQNDAPCLCVSTISVFRRRRQSLKEIQTFDKSKVVPPGYVNWLDSHLKFHFLDDTSLSLQMPFRLSL